ncbi:hypothetical protein DFP72DRAFT_854764 [Ephemerocybe angulata]|uniref:Uncharacterized protein n=1 Tax=Ephemerocybe angulata TaxID=980116 RepID=A0A8H6LY33_9AGAR|nr:hypothetical protein DFP72DRAFT_854764 [Tulosesus angulatus]
MVALEPPPSNVPRRYSTRSQPSTELSEETREEKGVTTRSQAHPTTRIKTRVRDRNSTSAAAAANTRVTPALQSILRGSYPNASVLACTKPKRVSRFAQSAPGPARPTRAFATVSCIFDTNQGANSTPARSSMLNPVKEGSKLREMWPLITEELGDDIYVVNRTFISGLFQDVATDKAISEFLSDPASGYTKKRGRSGRWTSLPKVAIKEDELYSPLVEITRTILEHFGYSEKGSVTREPIDTHSKGLKHDNHHKGRPDICIRATTVEPQDGGKTWRSLEAPGGTWTHPAGPVNIRGTFLTDNRFTTLSSLHQLPTARRVLGQPTKETLMQGESEGISEQHVRNIVCVASASQAQSEKINYLWNSRVRVDPGSAQGQEGRGRVGVGSGSAGRDPTPGQSTSCTPLEELVQPPQPIDTTRRSGIE